ncbi:UNVERIFIED_CONTAM: hypothetical protein Sindi_0471300 [Sesamum indicum]
MMKFSPLRMKPSCNRKTSLAFLYSSATPSFLSAPSSPHLSNMAAAILNSPTLQQAFRIFNSASRNVNPAKTLKLHSTIIHLLTEAKLYVKARCLIESLIETLRRTRKPHKVCSSIFNALKHVQTSGCRPNVFGVLIDALCERGFANDGYWVYYKMGKLPAVQACNALLNGILKTGRVEPMWEVYNDMVLNGLLPSSMTYGILIDSSCDRGDIVKARLLLEEMIQRGLKPTIVIYTTLIHGLCIENNMLEAEKNFTRMQEYGVVPNLYTYNALIDGYAKMASVEKARRVYYEMLNQGVLPNVITYSIIIYLLCKKGELIAFRSYFVHMVKLNVIPNIYIYNCLMDGFCEAGDLSTTMHMHLEMEIFGILPDGVTYGILMKGYCRIGRIENVENLFCKMNNERLMLNYVLFNTLIDGYCRKGSMEKAMEISSQMIEKGLQPDIVTFCTLINGYCKAGKLAAAKGLYNELTIKGYKPDVVAYSPLIDGQFENGYTDAPLQLHKEMMDAGIPPNIFTISSVIDGLCKDGWINTAINFFLEQTTAEFSAETGQVDSNHMVYRSPNNITYSILINGLCKNGQTFKYSKFFSNIRSSGLQLEKSDYAAIIEAHFGAKHVLPVMMPKPDMVKMGILPNAFIYKVLDRDYQKMAYFASAQKCRDHLWNLGLQHSPLYNVDDNSAVISECRSSLEQLLPSEKLQFDSYKCKFKTRIIFQIIPHHHAGPIISGPEFLPRNLVMLRVEDRLIGERITVYQVLVCSTRNLGVDGLTSWAINPKF